MQFFHFVISSYSFYYNMFEIMQITTTKTTAAASAVKQKKEKQKGGSSNASKSEAKMKIL